MEARFKSSLSPATPVMLIGFELNRVWPRTMLARRLPHHPFSVITVTVVFATRLLLRPGIKQVKDHGRKRRAVRVSAQRIIDPDEEGRHGLRAERYRPAGCTVGIQSASPVVERLRGCQCHLEIHDGLLLLRRQGR